MTVLDDDEIERSRSQDQTKRPSSAKRASAERIRRKKLLGEKLLKAKFLNDARAYAEVLRWGEIDDSSAEWKRAWNYFYDRES